MECCLPFPRYAARQCIAIRSIYRPTCPSPCPGESRRCCHTARSIATLTNHFVIRRLCRGLMGVSARPTSLLGQGSGNVCHDSHANCCGANFDARSGKQDRDSRCAVSHLSYGVATLVSSSGIRLGEAMDHQDASRMHVTSRACAVTNPLT